jgi:hypothetical protein
MRSTRVAVTPVCHGPHHCGPSRRHPGEAGASRGSKRDRMSVIVIQALWFGFAALIIVIDRQLMAKPIDQGPIDPDNVDLKDRSVGSFIMAMLLFGGL